MQEPRHQFPVTRWTLLQTLREGTAAESEQALAVLCQAYWFPLYAVARSKMTVPDAEDAVQGFFLSLLKSEIFHRVDEGKGRLRSYLLKSFENYCSGQWRMQARQKRGGETEHINLLTLHGAETRYIKHVTADCTDVETLFNREWARSLLERSLNELREEHASRGQADRFQVMAVHLTYEDSAEKMAESAAKVGVSHDAYRTSLHRLREEFRGKIESELSRTLDTRDPVIIREEMLALIKAFS